MNTDHIDGLRAFVTDERIKVVAQAVCGHPRKWPCAECVSNADRALTALYWYELADGAS